MMARHMPSANIFLEKFQEQEKVQGILQDNQKQTESVILTEAAEGRKGASRGDTDNE